VRGKVGRPRRRPDRVTADRGYDHDKYRRELRARRIKPEIARRQTEHGSGLGRVRWVVERTFAWLHHYKRLLVRYDRPLQTLTRLIPECQRYRGRPKPKLTIPQSGHLRPEVIR
jgi:transposase